MHVAGRVMLWLLYVCPPLQGKVVGHAQGFVLAAKSKLISFLDDPAYLLELAVAQYMDPRFKDLVIYKYIWSDVAK